MLHIFVNLMFITLDLQLFIAVVLIFHKYDRIAKNDYLSANYQINKTDFATFIYNVSYFAVTPNFKLSGVNSREVLDVTNRILIRYSLPEKC